MGRVIRHEFIALRCELRSCAARHNLEPLPLDADQALLHDRLSSSIEHGWVLVLTPQLRSYCPRHASSALRCTCRTNPDRTHLCVRHDAETASLVWGAGATPNAVAMRYASVTEAAA